MENYSFIDQTKISGKLTGVQYRCECLMAKNDNNEVPVLCPDHWQAIGNYMLTCEECGASVFVKPKAWTKSRCDACQKVRTKTRNSVAQKQRQTQFRDAHSDVLMRSSLYKMSLAEIAQELDLTTARVQQIEKVALAKFRENWVQLASVPLLADLLCLEDCSFTVQREYLAITREVVTVGRHEK